MAYCIKNLTAIIKEFMIFWKSKTRVLLSGGNSFALARKGWGSVEKKDECEIRLNWLCSLGYASKKRRMFSITDQGRVMIHSEVVEEGVPSHAEIQKYLIENAKIFGLIGDQSILLMGTILTSCGLEVELKTHGVHLKCS